MQPEGMEEGSLFPQWASGRLCAGRGLGVHGYHAHCCAFLTSSWHIFPTVEDSTFTFSPISLVLVFVDEHKII